MNSIAQLIGSSHGDLSLDSLVSKDGCYVDRKVFGDERVYELEKKHIFSRHWLYLGHESQVANPNDFFTTYMGEAPIIVSRGEDNKIHASINSCSHRGLPVCRADHGNAKRFVCPYHNWSYASDGSLAAVPQERKVEYKPNKSVLGLPKVPRVESYNGLIFGCLDESVEPLEQFLGNSRWYLDCLFDRFEQGVEVIGSPHKWLLSGNWKLPVENQLGDVAHAGFLHGSFMGDTDQPQILEEFGVNVVPEPGHGVSVRMMPKGTPIEQCAHGLDGFAGMDPEVIEYITDQQRRVGERLDEVRSRLRPLCYSIFPNFSFLWPNSTIRVAHPKSAGQMEYWSWWVVDKAAPDSVKEKLRLNYTYFFGPGGILEQEDSEAWMQQYVGSRIPYADQRPYYYGMGYGEESTHPELPGATGSCYNEHYAREYYLRWLEAIKQGEAK